MTIILVMTDTLSLAYIKAHLSEIVDRIEHHHDRVVLTKNGKPATVLVSPEELESLEDTLDLLSNPKIVKAIDKARKEVASGKILTSEELRNKYIVP